MVGAATVCSAYRLGYGQVVLCLSHARWAEIVAHCLGGYPLEACGLLAGVPESEPASAEVVYPTDNAARSSRVYSVEPRQLLTADRDAERRGMALIGVFHSHTHTDAYPSRTDVAQAPDPAWHYVLVSLRDQTPTMRSYRITDGKIREEPVVVPWVTG